jgi:hypothetical protein
VVEHGMAAIRPDHEERLRAVSTLAGEMLKIDRSGILSEQVHAGYWKGDGGGYFRMKALTEGAHRRDHDATAHLPGQVGADHAHAPESHAALVRYHETLLKAAASLPDRTRALLTLGMCTWEQYIAAYHAIQAGLADAHDHALEGWDPDTRTVVEWRQSEASDAWHSIEDLIRMSDDERAVVAAFLASHPACKRARLMSRREAWDSGRDALVRIPLQEMPMLLMPDDSRRANVGRDGLIRFHDRSCGRDEMIYHAQIETRQGYQAALPPHKELVLWHNPLHPAHVWLADPESGRMLGMAPRYDRAPRYDQAAILRAAGAQNADLARKILPVRGRHQLEAEARAAMVGRNADVLAGRIVPVDPLEIGPRADLAEMIGEPPPPEAEDDDDAVAMLERVTAGGERE